MAKPLHPPAPVLIYALVYVLLSLQVPFNLAGELRLVFSGLLFAPMLAAWLGWRFGRRGLLPLWLSAPVTAADWSQDIGTGGYLSLGFGPALLALCALATLLFAARREGAAPMTGGSASPAGMAVSAGLLLVSATHAELGAWIDGGAVRLLVDAPWLMAVAAFGLVVFRRAAALFVAGAVTVIAAAGYGLNLFMEVYALGEWDMYPFSFYASAGWGIRAIEAFSFGVAAVLAGLVVRDWPGLAAAAQMKHRAAAGLAMLLLAAPLLMTTEYVIDAALDAAPEESEMAALAAPAVPVLSAASLMHAPVLLQASEDTIIVTASRRGSSVMAALGHPVAGHLLALFSLVLGAALRPRAAFWLPQAVVLATVITGIGLDAANYGAEYLADSYFAMDFAQQSLNPLLWTAVACWTFAWLGLRAQLRHAAAPGGTAWTAT